MDPMRCSGKRPCWTRPIGGSPCCTRVAMDWEEMLSTGVETRKDAMSDFSYETFDEFERVIEKLETETIGRLPHCESNSRLHHSPEMVSFRLGRVLGRLGGYRDHFYLTQDSGLRRRFLSRKVRPCLMTVVRELGDIHGLGESTAVAQSLQAWLELAMSDLGVDYETLD